MQAVAPAGALRGDGAGGLSPRRAGERAVEPAFGKKATGEAVEA
ncbi:hypothetical protein [Burkholderia pyrrocinia]|nr:hypothetical protein [Burkholderia pyrrocinia]